MENRYKEGLRNIGKKLCAVERELVALAAVEKDEGSASAMRIMAMALRDVAGWVTDEIRDADDEVRNGGRRQ